MWPFRRRKEKPMPENGLAEARRARIAAEARLAVTHSEVTVPLRMLHRENHIQPLINDLIARHAERRRHRD